MVFQVGQYFLNQDDSAFIEENLLDTLYEEQELEKEVSEEKEVHENEGLMENMLMKIVDLKGNRCMKTNTQNYPGEFGH